MNRLTEKGFNFDVKFIASNLQSWPIAQALKRLQAIEDLLFDAADNERISLDRLAEICAAEKDGRQPTLPCKIGDICYEIDPGHPGAIKHTVTGTTVYNRQADGKRYMTDFVNVITIDTQAVAEDGCEWADQYTAEEWAAAPKTRPNTEAAQAGKENQNAI